jgi:hypothetical protein
MYTLWCTFILVKNEWVVYLPIMVTRFARKLKEHERKYTTHDLEMEDIIHALKM